MGAIIRGFPGFLAEAKDERRAVNHFSVRSAILRVRDLPGLTKFASPTCGVEGVEGDSARYDGGVALGSVGVVGMSDMATRKLGWSLSPESMYSSQLSDLNPTEVMIPIERS